MKAFDRDDKINYVDENNRFVGFDMNPSCCENFGHGVFSAPPEALDPKTYDLPNEPHDIEPYSFADEPSRECLRNNDGYEGDGGGLAFRIVADGLPDLFVVIWNHHNGYYAHGFTTWMKPEEEYL